jgi:DNA-binding SARP family transcriptional activator
MTLARGGEAVPLPASRKVRALIAYLALARRPQTRSHLCELLGETANDRRGELRWCLSRARSVLDGDGRRRIATSGDVVSFDLEGCFVDAVDVEQAMDAGLAALDAERLRQLSALFAGEFLEGLELERAPLLAGWLLSQRRQLRSCRIALLERQVAVVGAASGSAVAALEQWLALAPFDRRAHELILEAFAARGRRDEAEEHLAAAARRFEAEGLDARPLREAWRRLLPTAVGGGSAALKQAGATSVAADPRSSARSQPAPEASSTPEAPTRRASIAVMPFDELGAAGAPVTGMAAWLAHDVITQLAKLRSLFVIAQGTVFALHERSTGARDAGRTLDVDYVVGGSLRREGSRIAVSVELSETRTARVVWAEIFSAAQDDAFRVLDDISRRIVASLAGEIEALERDRARLKAPSSLDAWEAYHRGLWHMYRFDRADNVHARRFFEMAVRLDAGFARAHAGLSFTHFQDAFQGWADRAPAVAHAYECADRSLAADDRDPAAHWSMGRALWLNSCHEEALTELEEAVHLSPNFALGHYTLAFVHSQAGDPHAAIAASDQSRLLSPFDPMLFAMLAARAMALVRLERFDEAADWAVKAASRPNAHAHILGIATHCLALAGRGDEARACAARLRQTLPHYGLKDFLAAFRFAPDAEAHFRRAAGRGELA